MGLPSNVKLGLGFHVVEDKADYHHFQVVMFDKDFVQLRRLNWDRRRGFNPVSRDLPDAYRLHTRAEFVTLYRR